MADNIDLDALAEQIADSVGMPQSTVADGINVTLQPVGEQIEALKFLERRRAVRRSPLGQPIRVNRGDALG